MVMGLESSSNSSAGSPGRTGLSAPGRSPSVRQPTRARPLPGSGTARPVQALGALRLRQDRAAGSRPEYGGAGLSWAGRRASPCRSPAEAALCRRGPTPRPPWARALPPPLPPARSSLGVDAPGSLFQAPRERVAGCPDELGPRPTSPRSRGQESRGATREPGIEGPGSQGLEPWRKPSLPTGAVGRGPSTPPSLADPAALVLMSPKSSPCQHLAGHGPGAQGAPTLLHS